MTPAGVNISVNDSVQCTGNNTDGEYPLRNGVEACLLTAGVLLFGLVGVAGNLCMCVTIRRTPDFKTPTYLLLVNLAVADLLVLVCCSTIKLYEKWAFTWHLGNLLCKATYVVENLTLIASLMTIMVIAIERYIAICHPLRAASLITKGVTTKVIAVIWVGALCISVPLGYLMAVQVIRMDLGEIAVFYGQTDNFEGREMSGVVCFTVCKDRRELAMVNGGYQMLLDVVGFILPAAVLLLVYGLIGRRLLTADAALSSADSGASRGPNRAQNTQVRRQVIRMLAFVTAVFFFCWLPRRVFGFTVSQWQKFYDSRFGFFGTHYIDTLTILLVYVNSAVNPIIYNLLSSRFRAAFIQAICGGDQLVKEATSQGGSRIGGGPRSLATRGSAASTAALSLNLTSSGNKLRTPSAGPATRALVVAPRSARASVEMTDL